MDPFAVGRRCPQCSNHNSARAKYCNECGSDMASVPVATTPVESRRADGGTPKASGGPSTFLHGGLWLLCMTPLGILILGHFTFFSDPGIQDEFIHTAGGMTTVGILGVAAAAGLSTLAKWALSGWRRGQRTVGRALVLGPLYLLALFGWLVGLTAGIALAIVVLLVIFVLFSLGSAANDEMDKASKRQTIRDGVREGIEDAVRRLR